MVHYNSKYDNISAAIADNQTDSVAVVGIFIREVMPWDQFHRVVDSESIIKLKKAANELAKPWKGPEDPSIAHRTRRRSESYLSFQSKFL